MKKLFLIPSLITMVGMPLSSFISCSNSNENSDFNTCTWKKISEACNKFENGEWNEERFCQEFSFGETHPKNLSDFVGQERFVKINGVDHKVTVIGTQQDYMNYDESNGFSKPVVFTFQFTNLISYKDGGYLSIEWNQDIRQHNYKYWDSILENALNGVDSQNEVMWRLKNGQGRSVPAEDRISVLALINKDNSGMNIKDVYRGVNTFASSAWNTLRKQTKIFCPTIANVFSQNGIKSSPELTDETIKQLYCDEGEQYAFYKQDGNIADSVLDYETIHNCLVRTDCSSEEGDAFYYWFSTPDLTNENLAWSFGSFLPGYEKVISFDNVAEGNNAIVPCFCI